MPAVVLFEPEIPPNTGSVARTCAAATVPLHLIEPLGFQLTDRQLKRAGLDYWPQMDIRVHGNWQAFCGAVPCSGRRIGFSARSSRCFWDERFGPGDQLIFGPETRGLPRGLQAQLDLMVGIPMAQPAVRSLNLSVAVGVALFEA
ncbi:MAG: tRNA (cytidine(34)-2'-O)-methyltransferase, partial [Aphanocapsa feldmannii 288cV]